MKIHHHCSAGLVAGLLAVSALAGCKGGTTTEQATPAAATRQGEANDKPKPIDKASPAGTDHHPERERADDPRPAPTTQQPAPPPPDRKPLADPGCEKDCKSIGYCVRKNGECAVGAAEHCRQSDNCRVSGACSTKEMRNDDGTLFLTCTAATDEDCKGAETCKDKGNCKALDGFCTNTTDPETQKYRADKVKSVRDLAFKITKECEATKAKTLRLFKQDGLPSPAASWAEMEGLNRELIGVVIDFRRQTLAHYDVILNLVNNDKDLLGSGCHDALKEGVTKAKDGCLFNGSKQKTRWLRTLAKDECDR